MNTIYILISVLAVSLISVVVAIPILIVKKVNHRFLLFLLGISVGVLLGTVFLDFFPEIFSKEYNWIVPIYILFGFLIMFVLEISIHWHHSKKCENEEGHQHAYSLAPINLFGDGVHNFIDGIIIAGSYSVNVALGIAATISIIFHEIPQELADFGVLLYSGMSKRRAIIFNLFSAMAAIVGAVIGIIFVNRVEGFTQFVVPFAAGNFIYIAASNLVPEIHKHLNIKDKFLDLIAIILGFLIMFLLVNLV